MIDKPASEELLPEFMQATTDFIFAVLVFFGSHAFTTYMLLRYGRLSLAPLPSQYVYVLGSVIKDQNVFYLIHLVPAIGARYFLGKRLPPRQAVLMTLTLQIAALFVVYPIESILTPRVFRNILLYVSAVPLFMTYYTLRIYRLRLSGGLVIFAFISLLAWGALS